MSFDEFFDGLEEEFHVYERPGVVWKYSNDNIGEEAGPSGGSNDSGEDEYSQSPAGDSGSTEDPATEDNSDEGADSR